MDNWESQLMCDESGMDEPVISWIGWISATMKRVVVIVWSMFCITSYNVPCNVLGLEY